MLSIISLTGIALAEPQQSCDEYCSKFEIEDVGPFACYPKLRINNSTEVFINAGLTCKSNTSEATYDRGFHPSYNTKLRRCEGYIGVPKEINCSSKSPENTRRLCHCISPCKFILRKSYTLPGSFHFLTYFRLLCFEMFVIYYYLM